MNYTAAQLELDFDRCWRCKTLDRSDWRRARCGCRVCGSRRIIEAGYVSDEEKAKVAAGWFEDENNK